MKSDPVICVVEMIADQVHSSWKTLAYKTEQGPEELRV